MLSFEAYEGNLESPNPSAASTSVIRKTENGYEEGCAWGDLGTLDTFPSPSNVLVEMNEVTLILRQDPRRWGRATEQLFHLVYNELRRLAASQMTSERPDHTLSATAAGARSLPATRRSRRWTRMEGPRTFCGGGRSHATDFGGISARKLGIVKQGGNLVRKKLPDIAVGEPSSSVDICENTDEAIDRLAEIDPQAADIVRCGTSAG
ncbi:MAG: ECF-type sigma factor [Pirellulales bacterium]